MMNSKNCKLGSTNFDYHKTCLKKPCQEKTCCPPLEQVVVENPVAFAYLFNRVGQTVEDRAPVIFTNGTGLGVSLDSNGVITIQTSGYYATNFHVVTEDRQGTLFFGLYANGALVRGTKYGIDFTALEGQSISHFNAGDQIIVVNLSGSPVNIPQLVPPYAPDGISVSFTLALLVADKNLTGSVQTIGA